MAIENKLEITRRRVKKKKKKREPSIERFRDVFPESFITIFLYRLLFFSVAFGFCMIDTRVFNNTHYTKLRILARVTVVLSIPFPPYWNSVAKLFLLAMRKVCSGVVLTLLYTMWSGNFPFSSVEESLETLFLLLARPVVHLSSS